MRSQSLRPRQMPRRRFLPTVIALLAVAAACGEGVTDVSSVTPSRRLLRGAELAAVHFVSCPSATSDLDALGIVDFGGGVIEGQVAAVHVPIAAVDDNTGIVISTPASDYLEYEFHANGGEHYDFDRPITVTIDYSRCPASAIASHAALRVIYIDAATKQPLEDMGGVVDSVARTITFQTGHFSSYAVAD